jgi:hypothetical protein
VIKEHCFSQGLDRNENRAITAAGVHFGADSRALFENDARFKREWKGLRAGRSPPSLSETMALLDYVQSPDKLE